MPQVLEEKNVQATQKSGFDDYTDGGEFNYQPVPVLAVCGFVLALLSAASVIIWIAIPLAVVALLISLAALAVITTSRGAYGGKWLAITGTVLPVVFAVSGVLYQWDLYKNELPEGYQRVSFYKDISAKQFVEDRGALMPHPDVVELQGKQIFLKGYIYPTEKMQGLTKFLLLKDNQNCCFGGKPALQDRMIVELEDMTFDHTYNKVSVAGVFEINPKYDGDQLDSIYTLKATSCTLSASDF